MHWARHDRVMIEWGGMGGPTFTDEGNPAFHHYVVSRGAMGDGSDARRIETTNAEAFIDYHVTPARAYRYAVQGASDAGEATLTDVAVFNVTTALKPPADPGPPTDPSCLTAVSKYQGIEWSWNPSTKLDVSRLLGYLVESSSEGQPRAVVWEKNQTTKWLERTPAGQRGDRRAYRLRAIDVDLNVSEPSDITAVEVPTGWTVYRYQGSQSPFEFRIEADSDVEADILIVGGGGSGGGGLHGGGGGAGGFRCLHNVIIAADKDGLGSLRTETAHGHSYPTAWDWQITVGDGGDTVLDTDGDDEAARARRQGKASVVGSLIAYGGGYGSREGGTGGSYLPSSGASGGGAWPYEVQYADWGQGVTLWRGFGAHANHNESGEHPPCGKDGPPYGTTWDYESVRALVVLHAISPYPPQGHDGGDSTGSSAWYNHTSGGGGGANWPGYAGLVDGEPCGGLGRPCDIEGWPLWEETSHAFKYIPWFCGGGAGKERPNNWSYQDGEPGYGGGGACGAPGEVNTGGGGGGHGWLSANNPLNGQAPGPAGGRGVVIIRIPASAESQVVYPVPVGYEDVWDAETEEWVSTPIYPSGIRVTHVPEDQLHTDTQGDEIVQVYNWPRFDVNHDGEVEIEATWCHYGWDGIVNLGM